MFNDDIQYTSGYISKEEILTNNTQEEIFELVFGYKPIVYEKVISVFRDDTTPSCWFEYDTSGILQFVDFASLTYINNNKKVKFDCFDAVKIYYDLPNFYHTLVYISKNIKESREIIKKEKREKKEKRNTKIRIKTREFEQRDAEYFKQYNISSKNLVDDSVFAVEKFLILEGKHGDYLCVTNDLCYAHTDFNSNNLKLHRPEKLSHNRFITTCNHNDIYGINSLVDFGELLIITKSYKDYRVLKNYELNVIAFQNEGMKADNTILLPICNRFAKIIIFFDNDKTGLFSAEKLADYINSYFPFKSSFIHLPIEWLNEKITDPSDLIRYKGQETLTEFLTNNNVL